MFGIHPTTVTSPLSERLASNEADYACPDDRHKACAPGNAMLVTVARELCCTHAAILNALETMAGQSETDPAARLGRATADDLLARGGHRLKVAHLLQPLFVAADALRLEQVLTSLLANAAKSTRPGGHIRIALEAEAGRVVLRVPGDGRGIAPQLLPQVFDLFDGGSDPEGKHQAGSLGRSPR